MIKQGYYEHYKGGIYQVTDIAKDSETLEERVIYRAVDGQLWDRPVHMWSEIVNGKPRFKLLDKHDGLIRFGLHQHAYRNKNK